MSRKSGAIQVAFGDNDEESCGYLAKGNADLPGGVRGARELYYKA